MKCGHSPSNIWDDLRRRASQMKEPWLQAFRTRWLWAMSKPISAAVSEDELIISKSAHFIGSCVQYVWLDARGRQNLSKEGKCQLVRISGWYSPFLKSFPVKLMVNSTAEASCVNCLWVYSKKNGHKTVELLTLNDLHVKKHVTIRPNWWLKCFLCSQ